jgi:Fe2+ transport system protein FeoA
MKIALRKEEAKKIEVEIWMKQKHVH